MKYLLLIAMFPTFAHATEKYHCTLSPNNGLGIGFQVEVELLSEPGTANVSFIDLNINGNRSMQFSIVNPGKATRTGDIVELENLMAQRGDPSNFRAAKVKLDLAKMEMTMPPAGNDSASIPCKKVQ